LIILFLGGFAVLDDGRILEFSLIKENDVEAEKSLYLGFSRVFHTMN